MYQINSNQIGGRLSNADKERVNGVITKLQEATGETPQSFKELFLLMVDSIEKQMNNEVDNSELSNDNTDNNTENNVISLIFSKDAFSQIQAFSLPSACRRRLLFRQKTRFFENCRHLRRVFWGPGVNRQNK